MPLVYIVILNWNGWSITLECLQSLDALDYPNYRVLVVDNGSTDDSVARLKLSRPDLELIETGKNLGFTGGCNAGIENALGQDPDYILLFNNDAKAKPDMLKHLLDVAINTGAAICGARVLDETGTTTLFDGDRWPWTIFGLRRRRPPHARAAWSKSDRVDGCAMLLRRDFLEQSLLKRREIFWTDLFMYCEETELCRYAISHGYQCMMSHHAIAYHGLAMSSGGKGNPRTYYYLTRNRIYLANRCLSPGWKIFFHLYYAPSRLFRQFMRPQAARSAVWQGLKDGYGGIKGIWKEHSE